MEIYKTTEDSSVVQTEETETVKKLMISMLYRKN